MSRKQDRTAKRKAKLKARRVQAEQSRHQHYDHSVLRWSS